MAKILILLILLLLPIQADAFDEWTKKDTAYQLTYTALHIIDWGQTKYIAKNPDKFHEHNPILSKHPSVGKVDTYFIATLIGHTAISYILPSEYRRWWQVVWIGIEVHYIASNFKLGIKVDF